MSSESSGGSGGVGFTGLLTVLFIGLKLGGVIDWSWWWVLSPLWIRFSLGDHYHRIHRRIFEILTEV